jgi:hypothetical protein
MVMFSRAFEMRKHRMEMNSTLIGLLCTNEVLRGKEKIEMAEEVVKE